MNEGEVVHNITSEFIEGMRDDWSQEFAAAVNVKHRPEHDVIVAMSCYTMVYHIADNFRDGELRTEILDAIFGRRADDGGLEDEKGNY